MDQMDNSVVFSTYKDTDYEAENIQLNIKLKNMNRKLLKMQSQMN